MGDIKNALDSAVGEILSDQNYEQSFDFYRFWFDIGQNYDQISSDQIFDAIWSRRTTGLKIDSDRGKLTHSAAHSILRFASDAESDRVLSPHAGSGLQDRLCKSSLLEFFRSNLAMVRFAADSFHYTRNPWTYFYADASLVAHCANLGYVEEASIRDHILQSLISHPKLYDHQANALIILFKLAGATFEAFADPSVVDRCFELLKGGYGRGSAKWKSVEVCVIRTMMDGHRAEANFQELVALRERGWEGLPPPPVFTIGKPKPASANQKDPCATPVVTSLGFPASDVVEPKIPQPLPLEPVATPETDTIPGSPVLHSPSISITSLSDFTVADISDDESPLDPTAITPHDTFYLEDGNVEVLCGNTLFRVHPGTLSFHSPVISQMFAKSNLATAESPNGCPRILSSDTATDFATLLKVIYLPAYATLPRHE